MTSELRNIYGVVNRLSFTVRNRGRIRCIFGLIYEHLSWTFIYTLKSNNIEKNLQKVVHQIAIFHEHIWIFHLENYLLFYDTLSIRMDMNKYDIDLVLSRKNNQHTGLARVNQHWGA
jgi:hypothetical protein